LIALAMEIDQEISAKNQGRPSLFPQSSKYADGLHKDDYSLSLFIDNFSNVK
jgi:hypothetical protein